MSGERITQEEMDALREVLAEASPTPWQADFGGYHFSTMVDGYNDVGECIEASDGRAIVAVMNAVPRLLAEVEHLRRGIEAYRWYERNLPSIIVVRTDNDVKELNAACDSVWEWEREDEKWRAFSQD